jgi:hypothetical protein
MKPRVVAALLAAAALCLAAGATTAFAGKSTVNGTGHCNPSDPLCGANPLLTGPPPSFVSIPSNCPAFLSSDTWTLDFVDGNAVFHFTQNKNGDWGGGTAEGPAVLTSSDGTMQYSGHGTEWFGQGNNSGGQTVFGFTTNFNGRGPAGSLSIHANGHLTTNNSGTLTSNVTNVKVSCG